MIFNMSGGGGTGGLNFAVIGGLTQPTSPRENTIWVKTDTTITSWAFAPEVPTSPEGGMVFFKTDKTSPVGFNALRKNEITVLPTSAKQYIGGLWKNMEAHAYIGGTWVQFSKLFYDLYNPGDDGSLFVVEKPATTYVAMISTVFGADGISCKKNDSGTKGVVIRTKAPVDITNERGTLKMRAKVINLITSGDVYLKFGLGVNESNNVANAGGPNPSIGYHTYSLDLHNFAGTHNTIYIQLDSYDKSNVEVLIEELWLE